MKRKIVLCVLNKPYTNQREKIGKQCLYFTEKTMNWKNKSFATLRKIFPEPEFEIYSTNVDNKFGFSPNCRAKKINAQVPKLIKKFKAQIVVFAGVYAKNYYPIIKHKIDGNVLLIPHPAWREFTIKLRNIITRIARKNDCFKKEILKQNGQIRIKNISDNISKIYK